MQDGLENQIVLECFNLLKEQLKSYQRMNMELIKMLKPSLTEMVDAEEVAGGLGLGDVGPIVEGAKTIIGMMSDADKQSQEPPDEDV